MRALALPSRVYLPVLPFCSLAQVALPLEWIINHWFKNQGFSFFSAQQGILGNGDLGRGKQGRGGADNVHVSNCPRAACSGSRALCGTDCVCVCAVVCARIPPSLTARAGRYERRTPLVSSCGFAEQTSGCQRAACRFVTAVCGSAMQTQAFWRTLTSPPLFSGVAESPLIILLFGIMPLTLVGHMHARGSIGMGMKVKDG